MSSGALGGGGDVRQRDEESHANLPGERVKRTVPVPEAVPVARAHEHQEAQGVARQQQRQRREGGPPPGLAAEAEDLGGVQHDEVSDLAGISNQRVLLALLRRRKCCLGMQVVQQSPDTHN